MRVLVITLIVNLVSSAQPDAECAKIVVLMHVQPGRMMYPISATTRQVPSIVSNRVECANHHVASEVI